MSKNIFRYISNINKSTLWLQKRFMELENKMLIDNLGKEIKAKQALNRHRYILYYFSASWCNPCKMLLPKIKVIHEESKKRRVGLMIVYVPFDDDKETMLKYFKENHGCWYAIPFGDKAIEELRNRFNVSYVPYLVVMKKDGTVISTNARKEIEDMGIDVLVTWTD